MANAKVQIKSKAQMKKRIEKCADIGSFDIHLTFACLPRPRSINSAGPGPVGRGFDI